MGAVGIFEFWNVAPHLQTGLEIAIDYASLGNNVYYYHWGRHLPYNECYIPCTRTGAKLSEEEKLVLLCGDFLSNCSDDFESRYVETTALAYYLNNVYTLKRLSMYGYPLGSLVWGNVCDIAKSSMPDIGNYIPTIVKMISCFVQVYENTLRVIDSNSLDEAILFNGRFVSTAAVMHAASVSGVKARFHERGGDYSRYLLVEEPVHNILGFQRCLQHAWSNKTVSDHEAQQIGSQILSSRINRQDPGTNFFVGSQIVGSLGDIIINPSVTNIAFFCSSDDEYRWIPNSVDYPMGPWSDQRAAIFDLVQVAFRLKHTVHIYFVVHPNTLNKSADEQSLWKMDCMPSNCTVISPDMSTCSYALVSSCDLVITYGSTIGVEALGLGKPSLLMAPALYDYLSSVIMITSANHLLREIMNSASGSLPFDPCLAVDDASRYFFSLYNIGKPHVHYLKLPGSQRFSFLGVPATSNM